MDTVEFETFLAVVRCGSLVQASEALHTSQSTVSHRLQHLEASLGVRLLDRSPGQRGITLTADGTEFLRIAEKWELLAHEMATVGERRRDSLAIGAPDSISIFLLPPLYRRLHQHCETIALRVTSADSIVLYPLLERREIDVAFVAYEYLAPDLVVQPLVAEPMVLVSKTAFERSVNGEDFVDVRSLDDSNQLYVPWGPVYDTWHYQWWGARRGGVLLDRGVHMVPFLDIPNAWAIVPLSMARTFAADHGCTIYRLKQEPPKRICYLVYRQKTASGLERAFEVFMSCVKAAKSEMKRLALRSR